MNDADWLLLCSHDSTNRNYYEDRSFGLSFNVEQNCRYLISYGEIRMRYKKDIGDSGEQFAAEMLEASGFYILERNYRTKVGEIDIIACRDGVLHFVEVKTRTGTSCGYPAEAVTEIKRQRIRRAAEWYLGR